MTTVTGEVGVGPGWPPSRAGRPVKLAIRPAERITVDGRVIEPAYAPVKLPLGGAFSIDLDPGFWYWLIQFGSYRSERVLEVPDSETAEYESLVEVDPETLDPLPPLTDAQDLAFSALLADPASATASALSATYVSAVMPESFGAVGDGVTDDTAAVQDAIDSLADGGQVTLRQRYKITEVTITSPHVRLTGGGSIIDGTVKIGTDGTAPPYDRLFTRIDHLSFVRGTSSTTVHAITAARAYGIDVTDCYFENYAACFAVRAQAFSGSSTHHTARVGLSRLRTKDVQFVLRIYPYTSGGGLLTAADFNLTDSSELAVLDSHVYAEGIDGLVIGNVTMFMPGYQTSHTTKRHNIYVDGGVHIRIMNNQLFEAGLEAIVLSRVQDYTVIGNGIIYPGQRVYSDAIRIRNGDSGSAEFGFGQIDANVIDKPTRHGVSVEDNSGNVHIGPQTIHNPGDLTFFYGSGVAPASDYINAGASTISVSVAPQRALTAKAGTTPRVILSGSSSDGGVGLQDTVFIPGTAVPFDNLNWNSNTQSSAAFFGQYGLSTGAQDAYRTHRFELKPGTYSVVVWHHKDTNRGIYSVRLDGVVLGSIDGYNASAAAERAVLTGINIRAGGRRSLSLVMATKNASSSQYYGAVSGMALVRTGEPT